MRMRGLYEDLHRLPKSEVPELADFVEKVGIETG
jgi:hypothetical protein